MDHRKNNYSNERRKYNRIKSLGGFKLIIQENIFFTEYIKDISSKGIRVSHNGKYQFDPFDKFSFIILPAESDEDKNISGVAEVIRLVPFEEMGLKISYLDEINQEKFNNFVERTLKR